MDDGTNSKELSRNPTLKDVVALCQHLNDVNAKYIIIGGFAIMHWGFDRTTSDIDLLVDSSEKNIINICEALMFLPDQAVKEVKPSDIAEYTVVRIGDEFIIDLLGKACGISYDEMKGYIEYDIVDGIQIPYLKPAGKPNQTLAIRKTGENYLTDRPLSP